LQKKPEGTRQADQVLAILLAELFGSEDLEPDFHQLQGRTVVCVRKTEEADIEQ